MGQGAVWLLRASRCRGVAGRYLYSRIQTVSGGSSQWSSDHSEPQPLIWWTKWTSGVR